MQRPSSRPRSPRWCSNQSRPSLAAAPRSRFHLVHVPASSLLQTDTDADLNTVSNPPPEVMSPLIMELRARQARRRGTQPEPEDSETDSAPAVLVAPTEPDPAASPVSPSASDGTRAEVDPAKLGVSEGTQLLLGRVCDGRRALQGAAARGEPADQAAAVPPPVCPGHARQCQSARRPAGTRDRRRLLCRVDCG